jgi:hypothetical protein
VGAGADTGFAFTGGFVAALNFDAWALDFCADAFDFGFFLVAVAVIILPFFVGTTAPIACETIRAFAGST